MGIRAATIALPLLLGQTLALFAPAVSLTLAFRLSRGLALSFLALAFLFSAWALTFAPFSTR